MREERSSTPVLRVENICNSSSQCKPLHCQLCNSHATSPVQAKMHYEGKTHDKNVRNFFLGWPGNIRRQGNIKGFISCQETTKGKYQTAHWYTETTETCIGPQGRPIPMYVTCRYTHVHTCINTCSNISKPHMDVQHGISLFLTNLLIHSA